MSDFHNLQEENRRLAAEVERLSQMVQQLTPPNLTWDAGLTKLEHVAPGHGRGAILPETFTGHAIDPGHGQRFPLIDPAPAHADVDMKPRYNMPAGFPRGPVGPSFILPFRDLDHLAPATRETDV